MLAIEINSKGLLTLTCKLTAIFFIFILICFTKVYIHHLCIRFTSLLERCRAKNKILDYMA